MRNNMEDEMAFGTDEEFYRRLDEFYRSCFEWIRSIFWMIINSPCRCWIFIKSLPGRILDKFLKQYIAMTVFCLGIILLSVAVALVSVIAVAYSLTSVVCSGVSIFFQKGYGANADENSDEFIEQKRLLEHFSNRNTQEDDMPAGSGAKSKRQPSQRDLETLMEPRRGIGAALAARNAYQVPCDFHRSDRYTPLNDSSPERFVYAENSEGPSSAADPFPSSFNSDNSAGPSSDPDPFPAADVTFSGSVEDTANSFISTYSIEDIYDSDEPHHHLSQARLSADAVKAFGEPSQVFGADSFRVSFSSDEHCITNESSLASSPSEIHNKTAAVSVEIHPDSHRPINSSNDGSSSAEPPSMATDESARMADSDLYSNIPYMDDDQSSDTTCSTHLDEESTKTED